MSDDLDALTPTNTPASHSAQDWGQPLQSVSEVGAAGLRARLSPQSAPEVMDELKRQQIQERLAAQPYIPKSGNVSYCPACASPCEPDMTQCPECGASLGQVRQEAQRNFGLLVVGLVFLGALVGGLIFVTQSAPKKSAASGPSRVAPDPAGRFAPGPAQPERRF